MEEVKGTRHQRKLLSSTGTQVASVWTVVALLLFIGADVTQSQVTLLLTDPEVNPVS